MYDLLIRDTRRRQSAVGGDRSLLSNAESDRARLIFSGPFRRLQQKTQVFPLERNAQVRTRLTHSIEVAQIGRYISQLVAEDAAASSLFAALNPVFPTFVETACLMHDIGNPPFGHFGESAIRRWFNNNASSMFQLSHADLGTECGTAFSHFSVNLQPDFTYFDGNCQGFRIVSRLQSETDGFGLNQTFTQMATFLKYVCSTSDISRGSDNKFSGVKFAHKAGYFVSEEDIATQMWEAVNLKPHRRFPLAYIMEAADDIAYCLSDIEDAIEKRVASFQTFREYLVANAPNDPTTLNNILAKTSESNDVANLLTFKTTLTNLLCAAVAKTYVSKHTAVYNGEACSLLEECPDETLTGILNLAKDFARAKIYNTASIRSLELTGFKAISGILDHFRPLLELSRGDFDQLLNGRSNTINGRSLSVEAHLMCLFPRKHVRVYREAVTSIGGLPKDRAREWFHRCHLLTDCVSGMTDGFALETYQQLQGIRIDQR
ncbi:MAG: dGTPase [Casimicrobium sp.]